MKVQIWGAIAALLVLAGCASTPVEAPVVEAPSIADYGKLMVDCLGESGFEAEAHGAGVTSETTLEQVEPYNAAVADCERRYGFDATGEMTESQLTAMYDFELETQQCLEALGYPTTVPTKQTYIDHYYSSFDDGGFSLPHSQAREQAQTRDELEQQSTECPAAVLLYDGPIG
ncbi:MAG: hypothetical protein ACSHW9_02450 [Salinibacterium amurskyense]